MKRILTYLTILPMLLAASGCHHKDLCMECGRAGSVNVVFDWRNAPDADPGAMTLYLYDRKGGDPLRYVFTGREGGQITVPFGDYEIICMNSDHTDWEMQRNTGDVETFEIFTPESPSFDSSDLMPSREDEESEAVVNTPDMLWCDRGERFTYAETDGDRTVTLYPHEAVCHYIVDIYDIDNLEYNHGSTIFGSISGLSGGVYPGQESSTDNHKTMPFAVNIDNNTKSIHAEFLTFGLCPHFTHSNTLAIHDFVDDDSGYTYTYDVTDQVRQAKDPHHVHIILRGLPLPHPIVNAGGLRPVVEDWLVENITLPM